MVFLTQMIPCLLVYPQTTLLAGQLRGIRGLAECLLSQQHLKERNVVHTIGKLLQLLSFMPVIRHREKIDNFMNKTTF